MQKHKTCGITPAFLTAQSLFLCTDVPTTPTQRRHTHVRAHQQIVIHPLLATLKSSAPGLFCFPVSRGHWQRLETVLAVMTRVGGATGISWVEARDARQQPPMHRSASYNEEFPHPKCQ